MTLIIYIVWSVPGLGTSAGYSFRHVENLKALLTGVVLNVKNAVFLTSCAMQTTITDIWAAENQECLIQGENRISSKYTKKTLN